MTYKAIVKELVRQDAEHWVRNLLHINKTPHKWTSSEFSNIEMDKEYNGFLWEVKVEVCGIPGQRNYVNTIYVGGSVDDMIGICCSVIWSADKKKIIWMASEETRKDLNITEFKLS